ncbi:unnamed protein product [Rangifer tarandus platyrhynchus]|uniref:Uncharacterized protein n=2 Tax=Rangifer tarandus platyrhynchus TaxID=3082113 RepID=A0ACB0DX69_RANTA|nr:unnamed protein product [Rangifer tarandus platyrhynchus]CAI9692918.1 unnamed protein product [Rangifer tarandus platyrhynchus]
MREGLCRPPAAYCLGSRGCCLQPNPPPGLRSSLIPRSHLGPSESPSAVRRGRRDASLSRPSLTALSFALQVGTFAPEGVASRGGEDRAPLAQPARRDAAPAAALIAPTLGTRRTRSGRQAERQRRRG